MYAINLPQLLGWTHQAGEIALRHFNKNDAIRYKSDGTLLTQADQEIDGFLTELIHSAYPDFGLISEEGSRFASDGSRSAIWVIDPLDGTTVFSQGLPGWGISIGLLHRGQPVFGLFYMPLLDDVTYTNGRNEVYHNGRMLRRTVRTEWGPKGFLAVTASAHHTFQIGVRRTRTLGSVTASLIYTARGTAVGALLPRPRLWDLVAGAAVLAGAGGVVRYLSGNPIDYSQLLDGSVTPEPVVAGHPRLLPELQKAIR
jgi:myo-inositol-1(or 4)-monophosphatase